MADGKPTGPGMHERELMDAGAQAERTALAWQRTGFSAVLVGALLIRHHVTQGAPLWPGLLLTVAAGLAVLLWVPLRYRRVVTVVSCGRNPVSRTMVPATAAVLALVIVSAVVGFAAELCAR